MNSKQTDTAVAAPTGQREETIRAKPRSLTQQLERSALPILLLLVVVFFCIFPASRSIFPTVANASVVLANQSVVVLVATALLFPLVCGHFDFSVGATAVFSSLVCAASMAHFGLPVWAACLAATCVGALMREADVEPNIRWTFASPETIRAMVARGFGYSLLYVFPPATESGSPPVVAVPVSDRLSGNALVMALPPRRQRIGKVDKLAEILRSDAVRTLTG